MLIPVDMIKMIKMITSLSHFYFEDGHLICWFETQQNFEKVNDKKNMPLLIVTNALYTGLEISKLLLWFL